MNSIRNACSHAGSLTKAVLRKLVRLKRLPPVVALLVFSNGVHAVQGTEFIALPKYNLTDRFSVNHFNGEVSANIDTVAIGGERGLSHSVSARTNLFEYPGNRGFTDKFAAALRYKVIGRNVAVKMNGSTYPTVWVMSATALGDSADFLVMRNGDYAFDGRGFKSNYYYQALGDKRHTLKVEGNMRVWTKPDGTRVFFGVSSGGAGYGGSASKVVYPNGFTIYLHYDTGVTTNTGFQLKYDYIDTDSGLAPEKQGRVFPSNSLVPTVTQSNQSQWWRKNPRHVYGINRAVEYCDESTIHPCNLDHDWPKATFHWPGGMPRAIFIDETDVTIENASGGKTRLRYKAFDAARGDVDDPNSIIDGESPNVHIAPRMVEVIDPGASKPKVRYTYENQFAIRSTGGGSSPYILTRSGETKSAEGIMGSASYSHNEGRWGEIFHTGGGMKAGVSTALPGTLQELSVNSEFDINSFEASYRNFPKVLRDHNGPNKRYYYDARGNVEKVEHLPLVDGQAVVYKADFPNNCQNPKTCNKPLWVEDARGNRTHYTYHDESGQVATVTGPADQNGIRPVSRYYYEQYYAYYKKNGDSVEKANTPIWLLSREETCRATATVGDGCAGGALDEVVTEYDYGPQDGSPNNLQLRGVSVTGEVDGSLRTQTTCYEYDIYGHRIGEILSKGVSGSCSSSLPQQPGAYKYAKRYTPAGQLVGTISPDPDGSGPLDFSATRNIYDNDGRLKRTESGVLGAWKNESVDPKDWSLNILSSELYRYDNYGRKVESRSKDSAGNVTRLVHRNYDSRGNVKCKAVRMNLSASTSTGACRATSGSGGMDRVTRYAYNAKDQVRVEWRAYDTEWQQKYAEYTFDNMLRKSVTDANGNRTEYRHDEHKRLSRRVYPSKTTAGQVNESDYNQYEYDLNGNIIWERKRNGATFTYGYDKLNRKIKSRPNNDGRQVHYGYDLRDLRRYARFDSKSGPGIVNKYDGFGRVTEATNTMGGANRTLKYRYDDHGNRTRIRHPDGVSFSYRFDGLDRVTGVGEGSSTHNVLTIQYHANGGRDRMIRAGGAQTRYAYDRAQRIDELTQNFDGTARDVTTAFDFNPAGQIIRLARSNDLYHYYGNENKTGVYVSNGLNQYKSVNGRSYDYDANGNLTSDGVRSYDYDNENRLTEVTGGGDEATFEYDPLGRLFEVTVNGQTRQFLYDGDSLVAEYSSSGNTPVARYVHGDRVDEPWVRYNGSGIGQSRRVYLHTDHQGSIIAHSNGQGNALESLTYDSYGVAGAENVGRFGYTGQLWLGDIGLYYYKARMYSPDIGRFLQTDPIGYEDQMNLYAYVHNDPLGYTDPTGMSSEEIDEEIVVTGSLGEGAMECAVCAGISFSNGGNFPEEHLKVGIIPNPLGMVRAAFRRFLGKGVSDLFRAGRMPKASELKKFAEQQGWKPSQTEGGPLKYVDKNGVTRITIKQGSSRAPGSGGAHVELRNASGQRVDPAGNPVTRKSPENHTPIEFDL